MKLKNFCPYSVGDILVTTTTTNPSTKYLNTTWELIPSDRYIRSGSSALSTGGSNSVSIGKTNLPNIKLKVDSFSLTTQVHTHNILKCSMRGYMSSWQSNGGRTIDGVLNGNYNNTNIATSSGGGQNTGISSPSTETLGSGTALTIQPAYITLKFWKRLT